MASAAEPALSSSVQTTPAGATLEVHLFSSLPLTFALPILPNQATMADGATLLGPTSISPCPCSSRLPSTELGSSLFPTVG
ncbi:hypothetical protein EV2_006412 [Malus domestica]